MSAARRLRPLLIVVLALWLPLAAGIGALAMHARDGARIDEEARLRELAHALALAVDTRLSTYIAALDTLARSRALSAPLDAPAFLQQAQVVGSVLGGVIVLNGPPPASAVLVTTSPDAARMRDAIAAGALREAVVPMIARVHGEGRPALSDLFVAPVLRRPMLAIAVPVGEDPAVGLRLNLTIEPEAIGATLRDVGLPPWAEATIRDGRCRLVASTDPTASPAAATPLACLAEQMAGLQAAVLTGTDGKGPVMLAAAERLATDPRWLVTVAEPLDRQRAAMLDALRWPLSGLGLVVLGTGAVGWAARREAEGRRLAEATTLRDALHRADRLHAGLPAVLLLRAFTPEGEPGRLLYHAGDVEHVLGLPASRLATTIPGDLAEAPEEMRRFRARVLRTGEGTHDWRLRTADGGWRWLRGKARRLEQGSDGMVLVATTIVDITAERAAEALVRAASRVASVAELAQGLAHELKQPLQVIALKAEIAGILVDQAVEEAGGCPRLGAAGAGIHAALDGVVAQAIRSGALVEHLRHFARGAAAGAPPEPVHLDDAVEGALVLARHAVRQAGIALEVKVEADLPPVLGHGIAVEQILVNLLNNARDALAGRPRDGVRRIRIDAAALPDGTGVALTVADTAGGIAPEVLDRLFQPFVTTKGVDQGTGLGLAISQSLARDMGGTLAAENGAEGAVFTLCLPVAPGGGSRAADAGCPGPSGAASEPP